MEDDDWGLNAVVRGCSATSISGSSTLSPLKNNPTPDCQPDNFPCFPDLFETTTENTIMDLHDLYKPFFLPKTPQIIPIKIPSLPPLGDFKDLSSPSNLFQVHNMQASTTTKTPVTNTTTTKRTKQLSRPKRSRKNQMKRVCQVPAEGLSADMWSWRKYGQKPIKGSPYPRGYYRCSTSKGCMARKQVERHRSDPNMFIITYTGDHNHPMPTHRNSLAGSTRQKTSSSAGDANNPSSSPNGSLSQTTEKDDDELAVSDMALSDDFFAGLEDITGPSDGDSFSDQFAESKPFNWGANSSGSVNI